MKQSDTIIYLALLAIVSVLAYFYMKDQRGGRSMLENWAGMSPGNSDNSFSSNQMTASNIPALAPAPTDATTSAPSMDGKFVADPVIDSSTILPSNASSGGGGDGGAGTNLPPMLLSPSQQIGNPSPPSKISFIAGGDLRAIPCVSKGDQSQFPWGFSSYEPKDIYNGGYESVGHHATCN